MLKCIIVIFLFSIKSSFGMALKPKQYGADKRFKTWTYYPNTVYYYTGHYLNHTYIEFEDGESITTISTPKPKLLNPAKEPSGDAAATQITFLY